MKIAKQKRTGGFTLIELIVVIAILGILAGVGTVAYTGYIKAANKGVDKQTVGDLMYAAQLADYANPGLIQEGGTGAMIVISEKGTDAAGGTNTEQLKKALEDSVGSLDAVKLAYMEWAGSIDGATLKSMKDSLAGDKIGYTDANGNVLFKDENGKDATIGYAANADTLWGAVEKAAGAVAQTDSQNRTPGQFVQLMAEYTAGISGYSNGDSVGSAWTNSNTLAQSGSNEAVASSMGMCIARNFAFAEYLKSANISVSDSTLQKFQVTPTRDTAANDWVSEILRETETAKVKFGDDLSTLKNAAQAYQTGVYTKDGSQEKYSQAYLDGMIYYAMMHNVNEVSKPDSKYDPTSDTYLKDIGGYVSIAGSVFSGSTDWASMVTLAESLNDSEAKTAVVIKVSKEDGKLDFDVNPVDADPRDEATATGNSCTLEHTSSLTVTYATRKYTASTTSVILCTKDSAYGTCQISFLNGSSETLEADSYTCSITDGSDYVSYANGVLTAEAVGTAILHIEYPTNASRSIDIKVTVH